MPYQYSNSKHSQLIVESISEDHIMVHLVLWTRKAIDSTVSHHAKQYKNLQNCRICNTLQVMQLTIKYQRLMDYNTTAVN